VKNILKTYLLQVMKVVINLLSYEQPEFVVQTTTTISELKKAFEDEFGIPMQNFILKYKGQTLEDERTLAHYNIPDKGILDIEGKLISTLHPRYVNGHKDGLNSSGMTHEAGRDIKTMLDLLQQHSHLGALTTRPPWTPASGLDKIGIGAI
jgi:hypothetical protein